MPIFDNVDKVIVVPGDGGGGGGGCLSILIYAIIIGTLGFTVWAFFQPGNPLFQ